jgi:hypothetical protein
MFRSLIFAASLAAVASPAIAAPAPADMHNAFVFSIFTLSLGLVALTLLIAMIGRHKVLAATALATLATIALSFSIHPAFAQEVAAARPGVTLPYGSWIASYGPELFMALATWLAGLVTWALTKFAPWATSVLTQRRVELAAQALAQYAVKAVANSTKDGKVTVQAGPAVIATAIQRGVNVLPDRIVKAMEKGGGMASIIFRVLDLEDDASEHNVLQPAITKAKLSGNEKVAKAA